MASSSIRRPLLFAALTLSLMPSLAVAQAATVDQILGAVAEVIRDRAKQVASQTVARKLKAQLCEGTLEVPKANGKLVLHLGGSEQCRKSWQLPSEGDPEPAPDACRPDDLFIRTCRAAIRMETPLTDPYLLKSLSRDTVDFLMRVSARSLSEQQYVESGLVEVGAFVHASLEQLSSGKKDPGALADPLLSLADRISKAMFAEQVFADLAASGATTNLEGALRPIVDAWVNGGCAPYDGSGGQRCDAAWYKGDCDVFTNPKAPRKQVFEQLFGSGGPLAAGRNQVCSDAFPGSAEKQTQCWKARLTHNLYGQLVRGRCVLEKGDAARSRSAFRELTYVLGEDAVYREALNALAPSEVGKLDAVADAVQKVRLGALTPAELAGAVQKGRPADLPRAELAAAVRFLGAYAAALGAKPDETRAWLQALGNDLDAAVGAPSKDAYDELLGGKALGTSGSFAGTGFGALRGATKDLLTLSAFPVLQARKQLAAGGNAAREGVAAAEALQEATLALIGSLRSSPDRATPSELLELVARFVEKLASAADARGALAAAMGKASGSGPDAADFTRVAIALKEGAAVLALAADKDWVGLATRVSDQLARLGEKEKLLELQQAMRFVRVLLSMYQAESVAEAKAIFASSLEDAASRERRFDGFTVDVAALLGLRGGMEFARAGAIGESNVGRAALYGISAPVGLQLAYKHFGAVVYPLDLGSYVTGTGEPSGSDAAKPSSVRWEDALRIGLAAYSRPWSDVPVVFGAGADVTPRFDVQVQWRWYISASLELPLFTIH